VFASMLSCQNRVPAFAGMTEVTSEIDLKLNDNT
jgi:hypothetical protein